MLSNELLVSQQLSISTAQMQALEILNLTNQELGDFLSKEYLENPLIDAPVSKDDTVSNLEQLYEKGLSFRDQYHQSPSVDDYDQNMQNNMIRCEDNPFEISNVLLGQIDPSKFDKQHWDLFYDLVRCLDENGFFPYKAEDIATSLGYPLDMVNHCLEHLRGLEPIGIFSSNMSECIKMQLIHKGITDPDLFQILDEYMDDLMAGNTTKIMNNLHMPAARIKEYIQMIGECNPRPIMNVQKGHTDYIVPDVIATYQHGQWQVTLNDKWMGEYQYNDYYLRMMHECSDRALKEYFAKKYERARFIFNSVEQRRNTIKKVVTAILEMQDGYFRNCEPLVPMTLEDIANQTDVHLSTVSRAIKGKYLRYCQTVLIKDLFTSTAIGETSAGDDAISSDAVKDAIIRLIESEDKNKPYSDQKLANLLANEGMTVSRRTVTKYRDQEGILNYRQRKLFH